MSTAKSETPETTESEPTHPLENAPVESEQDLIESKAKFILESDPMTCFSIELLYTDIIEEIREKDSKLVGHYAMYGAAEGILRAAKLLMIAAPNNPELAEAVAKISNAISAAGFKITEEVQEENINSKREDTLLQTEEIDQIMNEIANIDVSLPDTLKK